MKFLALGALLGLLGAASAPSVQHFPADEVSDAAVRALRATGGPGAAVAVVRDGAIVYSRGFGVSRIGGERVTDATRFEIGSLTKQFTAAAILQLAEQRKLLLSDRISRFLPRFPHAAEISLLELLQQTSGLPDFMAVNHFVRISQTSTGGFERITAMVGAPLHFAPGSRWEYSNTNYIVLGRVIELVSHQSYAAYVKRHILAPAGMSRTSIVAHEKNIPEMATGYWRGLSMKGALVPAPPLPESWSWSAGDLVSTAEDIARWYVALSSGKIVSRADFVQMTTPARLRSGKRTDYAFHWWTDPLHGRALLSGLGDTFGFSSCLDVFPNDGFAVVVLENVATQPSGDSDAAGTVAASVSTVFLNEESRARK